jgi:hypothetical protein
MEVCYLNNIKNIINLIRLVDIEFRNPKDSKVLFKKLLMLQKELNTVFRKVPSSVKDEIFLP